VTPLAIYAARRRLTPFLRPTPLIQSDWLSSSTAAQVHLKVESMQPTRSFKIRGALNALLAIARRTNAARPTIVTASAGNHGQGIAWAAKRLGLPAVVFAPASAPENEESSNAQTRCRLVRDL
jgi:threonine dehydratase